MSVVNCKVKYIRPTYQNLQEWMADSNNVYIGRAGIVFILNAETGQRERFPKSASPFANPYKVGPDGDRLTVLQKYRTYIENRLAHEPRLVERLAELRGKRLGCWCHPDPCHGDVLLELLQNYSK